jgi:hypothetical protein
MYKYPYRFRCHIASEMLIYCHAPARSCSRLIPCEDRALTIRGFPRPAPGTEGCKGFGVWTHPIPPYEGGRTDPSPALLNGRTRSLEDGLNVHLCLVRGALPCATRGRSGYNRKHRASKTVPLRQAGQPPQGGRGWIKLSAHSCRNEVCDHSSASVEYER